MAKQVAEKSHFAYYVGLGLMVAGCLLFLSVLIAGALHLGDLESFARRGHAEALRALCGMILMMVGVIISYMAAW